MSRKKGRKVRRIAEDIIIVCLLGIVIVSGWKVYTRHQQYQADRAIYNEVSQTAYTGDFSGDIDFDALRKTNSDIVGWIYYESTDMDYPVVQGKDNDYYLHIAFDDKWALAGTLFVDAITEDAFNQFNTIIYGHHMQDGSMFGDLKKLKKKEYCDKHPQMELITPDGKYHLMIWAFLNQPSDSQVYLTNIHDRKEKQAYIDFIESAADYTTDVEVSPEDRLVVLSTCAYEYQDARYMVIGKMVPWENQ